MEAQITDYKVGTADEFKFGGLWPVSPHQFFDGKMFRIKSPTRIENAPATPTKCVSEERVIARTYDCYAITTICYIIRYGKSPFNSFLFSKIMEIFIFPFFGIT